MSASDFRRIRREAAEVSGAMALTLLLFSSSCNKLDIKGAVPGNGGSTATTASANAVHGGWALIKAVGAKAPAAQGADLATTTASVTLTWDAASGTSGAVTSYNIYRATSSGGQNFSAPLSTGISAVTRSYTDTTVAGGTTYYYIIAPVVGSTVERISTSASVDAEVKVMVPEPNMVLLHRWSANREICEKMGKTVDRSQNYRCAVATGVNAPPGTGGSGYVDLSSSYFVDMFEQGCNYTNTNSCTDATVNGGAASPCIGIRSTPSANVAAATGTIYYSRQSGSCYINTSVVSGTTWLEANSTTAANRRLMGSAAPGLPPLVNINQPRSNEVCSGQTVASALAPGTKRILTRREQLLAAAWDSSIADATITSMELGADLSANPYCNSSSGAPQPTGVNGNTDISGAFPAFAYSNAVTPPLAGMDTLPGCLSSDCVAAMGADTAGARIRSMRTGSNATSSCLSRYGMQDLVGNVAEWISDQILCNGVSCSGQTGGANTVDATNLDWAGLAFDGNQGPVADGPLTTWSRLQLPAGIPIVNAGFAGDGVVTFTAAELHSDRFQINNVNAGTRGLFGGGNWANASTGGRYYMILRDGPSTTSRSVGVRCIVAAD